MDNHSHTVSLRYNLLSKRTVPPPERGRKPDPNPRPGGHWPAQGLSLILLLAWLSGPGVAQAALVLGGGLGIANEPGKKFGVAGMTYYAGSVWEAGYLNEGVNHGTDGVFAEYRLTRSVTKRLLVTLALGPEVLNTTHDIRPGVRTNGYHASLLVSLSAFERLSRRWRVGIRWNHITFQQSAKFGYRDADMVLVTLGYGR